MGYDILISKAPVYYVDINKNNTLKKYCMDILILQVRDHYQVNTVVYAAIRKVCAECGLTWINKYNMIKYVRRGAEDLEQYYYVVDSREEAIRNIMNKIFH